MRTTQRLDKILSNLGYGSRKEIKEKLKEGAVKVDGVIVRDNAAQVDPQNSEIKIYEETLKYREFIYIMLNKPDGVISATFDKKLKTVIDILPEKYKNFELFPIGRLDIDTEGLLILTNDGQLTHNLLSPKKHVPKKYFALIDGVVTELDVAEFEKGIELDDGYKTMPAELVVIKQGDFFEIELVIHEGKFHQVKRMFEAVGKSVKYLKRIEMGELKLDDKLKLGECRELTDEEIIVLRQVES